MSEDMAKYGTTKSKYGVGDSFDFDGIVTITGILTDGDFQYPKYNVKWDNGKVGTVDEDWIDSGIDHFNLDANGRKKDVYYGVAYIASVPEEFKVGDRVKFKTEEEIKTMLEPSFWWGISIFADKEATIVSIDDCGTYRIDIDPSLGGIRREFILAKLPATIRFDESDNPEEPWNVGMFRSIAKKMVDTYARKNASYGDSFGKSVEKYGFISALTRMSDKFNRIENLILGAENKVPDESLEDTLIDLACYSVMSVIAMRDAKIGEVDFENVK